jgi:uncharacterized protein YndB with AHSA1/START domain
MTQRALLRRLALSLAAGLCLTAPHGSFAARASATPNAPAKAVAGANPGAIHEEIVIAASPDRVYEALLDSTQFAGLTHLPASIDRTTGGAFHCFHDMIEGSNVELVPGQRIVQAWRVYDWPAGVFSIVRFVFKPEGAGTRLVLTHSGWQEGEGRAPRGA